MYDDYPEPPPPPARCPNCNEELTDHPRPDLFFLDDSGAICDGPDGCGWWGTRQQAEEYALDVGEAHAEAMADDGPDWRSGSPRRAIPMPGVVPFDEDAELSRWLARHGYESADEWMRARNLRYRWNDESSGVWYDSVLDVLTLGDPERGRLRPTPEEPYAPLPAEMEVASS